MILKHQQRSSLLSISLLCFSWLVVGGARSQAPLALLEVDAPPVLQLQDHDAVDFYPLSYYGTSWGREIRRRGEPLNVILSGRSHPSVLCDEGFLHLMKLLRFEPECLNLHLGDPQYANLNDSNDNNSGDQWKKQLYEIRQTYFPIFGTCLQSAVGGNHFRSWKQDGTLASSNAWFLAVSLEHDYRKNHMIMDNGYDRGRDLLVTSARQHLADYRIEIQYLDLIPPGRHFNHGIGTDGRVALITVQLA